MRQFGPPLVAITLASGCGDPLGNGVFEEDRLFAEALPQRASLRVEHPATSLGGGGSPARDIGEPAILALSAAQVAWAVNTNLHTLLARVELTAQAAVEDRTEDSRRFAPVPLGDGEGSVALQVVRDAEAVLNYEVRLHPDGDATDEGIVVLSGTWVRDGDEREGQGAFSFDATSLGGSVPGLAQAGLASCVFERRASALTLDLNLDDWQQDEGEVPRDSSYHFHRTTLGGGILDYAAQGEAVGEDQDDEQVVVHARWTPSRAGRADALLSGGSLGDDVIPASECWDGDVRRTWWRVEGGGPWSTEQGEEDACVFAEREEGVVQ